MILTDEEVCDLHDEHTWRFEGLDGKEFRFIARAIEREVLRKLREQQHAASISGQWRLSESGSLQRISNDGLTPLHIIPEVNE